MRTGLRLGCSKHDNKETGLRSENNGYLGLFVLGLLALAIPNDVLYTTAQTYYKSCYARGEHMRVTLSRRPPISAEQELAWQMCDRLTAEGVNKHSTVRLHRDDPKLTGKCPNIAEDISVGGAFFQSVRYLMVYLDAYPLMKYAPAGFTIGRAWQYRWPLCNPN